MKQVFKCDFCSDTNTDSQMIIEHEKKCSFNPIAKKCYSCEHSFEDGYPISGHMAGCHKGLNAFNGEEIGNCDGYLQEIK